MCEPVNQSQPVSDFLPKNTSNLWVTNSNDLSWEVPVFALFYIFFFWWCYITLQRWVSQKPGQGVNKFGCCLLLTFSGFRNVDELSNTRPVATHVAMGLWKNRTSVAFENQAAIRLKIIFSHLLQFWCTLKAGWSLTVNMRSIETFTIQWISSCVDWHIPTHLEQSTTLSDLPNKTNNQILLLHLLAFNPTSN